MTAARKSFAWLKVGGVTMRGALATGDNGKPHRVMTLRIGDQEAEITPHNARQVALALRAMATCVEHGT